MHVIGTMVVVGISGGVLFCVGVFLGSLVGTVGSVEMLSYVIRLPYMLIADRDKLRDRWKMWMELRDGKKIDRLKKKQRIDELVKKIQLHKKHMSDLQMAVRRVKWEMKVGSNEIIE